MADETLNNPVDESCRRRFEAGWQKGAPAAIADCLPPADDPAYLGTLEELVHIELELQWKNADRDARQPPSVEDYLSRFAALNQPEIIRRLVRQEYRVRHRCGRAPTANELSTRFPTLFGGVETIVASIDRAGGGGELFDGGRTKPDPADESGKATPNTPQKVGRYRIERVLGQGGFGVVYLAHDEQLQRQVAVKVPHLRLSPPEEAAAYLREARMVAGLDHPNIVPIFDVGETETFPCFIVSKYIDGATLAELIAGGRLSTLDAVKLIATVADALHHAHRNRLVHRDVKPANILLDSTGTPFVVDFGLASNEQNAGNGLRYAGTPAYMSPEQARGESHRLDGRSDVFSLGVVLYELLAGRRPFAGESVGSMLVQIMMTDPLPPRQFGVDIPFELEHICLKALAKRTDDRYASARDLAEDLRQWLAAQSAGKMSPTSSRPKQSVSSTQSPADAGDSTRRLGYGLATIVAAAIAVLVVGVVIIRGKMRAPHADSRADNIPVSPAVPPIIAPQETAVPSTHPATSPAFKPTRWQQIFADESAYLGKLGGLTGDPGFNLGDPAQHMHWVRDRSFVDATDNLAKKYLLQFDHQASKSVADAKEFYATSSARIASYGIDLGDSGANSVLASDHLRYASNHELPAVRHTLEKNVRALMDGARRSEN